MDEKYILEGNDKIAKYLGAIDGIYFDKTKTLIIPGRGVIIGGSRECKYHESLEWLLPVVERISKEMNFSFSGNSKGWEAGFYDDNYKFMAEGKTISATDNKLINAIYQAVVGYIDQLEKTKE